MMDFDDLTFEFKLTGYLLLIEFHGYSIALACLFVGLTEFWYNKNTEWTDEKRTVYHV